MHTLVSGSIVGSSFLSLSLSQGLSLSSFFQALRRQPGRCQFVVICTHECLWRPSNEPSLLPSECRSNMQYEPKSHHPSIHTPSATAVLLRYCPVKHFLRITLPFLVLLHLDNLTLRVPRRKKNRLKKSYFPHKYRNGMLYFRRLRKTVPRRNRIVQGRRCSEMATIKLKAGRGFQHHQNQVLFVTWAWRTWKICTRLGCVLCYAQGYLSVVCGARSFT